MSLSVQEMEGIIINIPLGSILFENVTLVTVHDRWSYRRRFRYIIIVVVSPCNVIISVMSIEC